MVSLGALWLPIVVSAVIVFFVSAMVWMVMPHHKNDFSRIEDEDGLMDAIRGYIPGPGMYFWPFGSGSDMASEEYQAKVKKGPVGLLRVRSAEATLTMGDKMLKSLILYLVVGIFVAYLGSQTLPVGTEYLTVFQVTGTAAFMAHGFIGYQESIWFALPGKVALKHSFDGLLYALLTAGVFGWMWPS